jgi:hypothetical protein
MENVHKVTSFNNLELIIVELMEPDIHSRGSRFLGFWIFNMQHKNLNY